MIYDMTTLVAYTNHHLSFLFFKPLFVRIFQFHFYFYFSPCANKISLPFSVALALRKANFYSPWSTDDRKYKCGLALGRETLGTSL